jgi:hypothetical protein
MLPQNEGTNISSPLQLPFLRSSQNIHKEQKGVTNIHPQYHGQAFSLHLWHITASLSLLVSCTVSPSADSPTTYVPIKFAPKTETKQ